MPRIACLLLLPILAATACAPAPRDPAQPATPEVVATNVAAASSEATTAGVAGVPPAQTPASTADAPAQDPVAAMTAAIHASASEGDGWSRLPLTPRLRALADGDARRAESGKAAAGVDFDFIGGAQEPLGLRGEPLLTSQRTTDGLRVVARFTRGDGRPRELTSDWIQAPGGGWQLDDISDGEARISTLYRTGG